MSELAHKYFKIEEAESKTLLYNCSLVPVVLLGAPGAPLFSTPSPNPGNRWINHLRSHQSRLIALSTQSTWLPHGPLRHRLMQTSFRPRQPLQRLRLLVSLPFRSRSPPAIAGDPCRFALIPSPGTLPAQHRAPACGDQEKRAPLHISHQWNRNRARQQQAAVQEKPRAARTR